jgi:uncharacterized protein YegJ (DUF2314 family)
MTGIAKRTFGLITLLVGLAMIVWGLAHPWFATPPGFRIGVLLGSIATGGLFASFGYRWLLNVIDLDALAVDPLDPRLAAATAAAQRDLELFRQFVRRNRYDCAVKISMATVSNRLEHIWANVHALDGDRFVVSLANEPVEELVVKEARFPVTASAIEDWVVQLSPDRAKGGYSIRAIKAIARDCGFRLSRTARRQLERFEDGASVEPRRG